MGELRTPTPYEQRIPGFRPKENPNHFDDPQAQAISDRAWNLGTITPAGIRDKVGIAYIDFGLGLGEGVGAKFAAGDSNTDHLVGIAQSGKRVENSVAFWNAIEEVFPGQFSEEERVYFSSLGDQAITGFMATFENIGAEPSRVLSALDVNAHAYK
jgi:hypothetical protein